MIGSHGYKFQREYQKLRYASGLQRTILDLRAELRLLDRVIEGFERLIPFGRTLRGVSKTMTSLPCQRRMSNRSPAVRSSRRKKAPVPRVQPGPRLIQNKYIDLRSKEF
jgi:hypothetical protein